MARRWLLLALLALATGCSLPASVDSDSSAEVTDTPAENTTTTINFRLERFFGVVDGYSEKWASELVISGRTFRLDLINTYFGSCGRDEQMEERSERESRRSVRELLQIGTRVLVIRSDPDDSERVILHRLIDNDFKTETPEPSGSVNEQLVQTGFWFPWSTGADFDAFSETSTWTVVDDSRLSEIQKIYAPIINAAGNNARFEVVGGHSECLAMAFETNVSAALGQISFFRGSSDREREYRIYLRDNPRSCRDGDGDGICYER